MESSGRCGYIDLILKVNNLKYLEKWMNLKSTSSVKLGIILNNAVDLIDLFSTTSSLIVYYIKDAVF